MGGRARQGLRKHLENQLIIMDEKGSEPGLSGDGKVDRFGSHVSAVTETQ